jgi:hypothetical protein
MNPIQDLMQAEHHSRKQDNNKVIGVGHCAPMRIYADKK